MFCSHEKCVEKPSYNDILISSKKLDEEMPADMDHHHREDIDETKSNNRLMELVSCEWLRSELCSQPRPQLLIIDCRNGQCFNDSHIRGSVALAIPSIMLRRLAAGKVDLLSTIKCQELRNRVERMLVAGANSGNQFLLVGDSSEPSGHQGETIHVLAKRLRCSGSNVATLEGQFLLDVFI